MTLKEAIDGGGIGEILSANEGVADEALIDLPAPEPQIRHLAVGASGDTLCGLPRAGLATAHPSKAKRTDCLACRDAYRKGKVPPPMPAFAKGDRIEIVGGDGSAWLVKSVRPGGADVVCVLSGSAYAKGVSLTISSGSPARVFTEEEWTAATTREATVKPVATTTANPGTKTTTSRAKWNPTKAEVDRVKELRRLGRSYIAIEQEMGWPDGHGNRPFRIMKGAWDYNTLRDK